MDKKQIFGALSIISFGSILFLPIDSNIWIFLILLGIIFGIGWWKG